jgi:hypothetical protein
VSDVLRQELEIRPDVAVWYAPSPGTWYPAVADGYPRLCGTTWVVRLRELPRAYARLSRRTSSPAAALDCIMIRRQDDVFMPDGSIPGVLGDRVLRRLP